MAECKEIKPNIKLMMNMEVRSNAVSQVKLCSISDINLDHIKYINLSTSTWILDISITDTMKVWGII